MITNKWILLIAMSMASPAFANTPAELADANEDGFVNETDLDYIVADYTASRNAMALITAVGAWEEHAGQLLTSVVEGFEEADWPADWEAKAVSGNPPTISKSRLSFAGKSKYSAKVCHKNLELSDCQVSASFLVDSLLPMEVFLREDSSNYYAAAVVRGMQVQLYKVTAGKRKHLATVKSKQWTNGEWIKLTILANGDNLRVMAYRPKKRAFLGGGGEYVSKPTWCINLRDTSITEPGRVGVGRVAKYAGTTYVDDIVISPATGDSTPPKVAITSPGEGEALSDIAAVTADASDAQGVLSVTFAVDGVVRHRTGEAPYQWEFDTTTVANGSHTITVRASDQAENVGVANLSIETDNDLSVFHPDFARHHDHIRIAGLMYSGHPAIGEFERGLVENDIDLLIPSTRHLSKLHEIAPETPKLFYTNFSNLYQSLLLQWNEYADKHGIDREKAFYHAAKAVPFKGNSPSSVPVVRFWKVMQSGADLTSEAYYDSTAPVSLGKPIEIGYPERFRKVRFELKTPGKDWQGQLQCSVAGGDWLPLEITKNTTEGFANDGEIEFQIPDEWAAEKKHGDYLHWIRIETQSGSSPSFRRILAEDYTQAGTDDEGTIPASDVAALPYQSRIFASNYGAMRFAIRPSPEVREFFAEGHLRQLAGIPEITGFFVDNASGHDSGLIQARIVESVEAHVFEYATMQQQIAKAIEPNWLMVNVGSNPKSDVVLSKTPTNMREFLLRADHTYVKFLTVANRQAVRMALTSPPPLTVLDTHPGKMPMSDQVKMSVLAYYYLLADPERTMIAKFGGFAPSGPWRDHWINAVRYDVGKPLGPWSIRRKDSQAIILQRDYERALVLWRTSDGQKDVEVSTDQPLRSVDVEGVLGEPAIAHTMPMASGLILSKGE